MNTKKSTKTEEYRTRNWEYVVYEGDTNEYFKQVETITKVIPKGDYFTIKHTPERDQGKVHYHVLCSFPDAKTKSAFQKILLKLGFGEEHKGNVRNKDDFEFACQYLVHLSPNALKENKKTYSLNEVVTNNYERFKSCFHGDKLRVSSQSNLEQLIDICEWIDGEEHQIENVYFYKSAQLNGWDYKLVTSVDVRRHLENHNKQYLDYERKLYYSQASAIKQVIYSIQEWQKYKWLNNEHFDKDTYEELMTLIGNELRKVDNES